MCGRFTQFYTWSEIHEMYNLIRPAKNLQPSWNIAPTQEADIVVVNNEGRELRRMRFGLIPSWAKDEQIGNRMINARAETAAAKPAFRAAYKSRRCIIPASGFYEWRKSERGKQPFHFSRCDGETMSLAGLWERWAPQGGDEVYSFAILTTAAGRDVEALHDRMPVVIERRDIDAWLEAGASDLLRPAPAGTVGAHAVSRAVNSPANNGPELVASIGD